LGYRVLIVDDSPAMRSFVRRIIDLSGFELSACYEASHGGEALDVLREQWVDAILTDINMPVVDGEELLRRLSSDDLLKSIPAVVISTDATRHRISQMLSLGARGYVTKPFHPEDLRAELERILGCPPVHGELQGQLNASVEEVLEKMFFVSPPETPGDCTGPGDKNLTARVPFEGDSRGDLLLSVSCPAARSIAADFLAVEPQELQDEQISAVVCELANMICGSVLSRLESAATFHLAPPQIVPSSLASRSEEGAAIYKVETFGGALTVALAMGIPACARAAK